MTERALTIDQHFVARMGLKRFEALDTGRVWVYRLVVEHERTRVWKDYSIKGVAHHQHLYTAIVGGAATDALEVMLAREFEDPAERALTAATTGGRMTADDWERLIRYAFAQDLRVPKRMQEFLARQAEGLKETMEKSIAGSLERIERGEARRTSTRVPTTIVPNPFEVSIVPDPESGAGFVKAEASLGRSLWLFHLEDMLINTWPKVPRKGWTIVRPARGMRWITSDAPVVRLGYLGPDGYDFKAGWAQPGANILLPLDPEHLLFCERGRHPPSRDTRMSEDQTRIVRRVLAEHAHRMIIASTPDSEIASIVPRVVDAEMVRGERAFWEGQQAAQRGAPTGRVR